MDRIRWSERAIPFSSFISNPNIPKPSLVLMGNKAIVVGEKIGGEFIMASPCKLTDDRFDIMEQEIILSSKHTGLWRVISRATPKKEGHVHRLTTKDLERIHKQDLLYERASPRTYICIKDVEAFELIILSEDPAVANGQRIERRAKPIEENVEFEIVDIGEVEYTPSEAELTSHDYILVPKGKQPTLLQLLLPGVIEQEHVIRNRVVRALHCRTIGETRRRHFILEVSEHPCEIRPIASEGSSELRYLHSTQNLYNYMLSHENNTVLYVKLLRGDPPIKAIEFDGYMVMKSTINGDKIPICRVEDLEITLVTPDLPVKVRLPTKSELSWHSLSEVRAAEVQCMQLSLALFARHESEMYVTNETQNLAEYYTQSNYNETLASNDSRRSSNSIKKHLEECERVFGHSNSNGTHHNHETKRKPSNREDLHTKKSVEQQFNSLAINSGNAQGYNVAHSNRQSHRRTQSNHSLSHEYEDRHSRTNHGHQNVDKHYDADAEYNRFHRTTIRQEPIPFKSQHNHNKRGSYELTERK